MNQEISREEKRQIKKKVNIISLILLVGVLGYLAISYFLKIESSILLGIVVIGGLSLYAMLVSVLEPLWMGMFVDITPDKKTLYIKSVACEVGGIICISLFIFSIGSRQQYGIYFALGYVLLNRLKYKFRKEFFGEEEEEEVESTVVESKAIESAVVDSNTETKVQTEVK